MFEQTRIRLTAWYLVIIMTVSLLFSVSIYSRLNVDLSRFEIIETRFDRDIDAGRVILPTGPNQTPRLNAAEIQQTRTNIIFSLGFINLVIFFFAGTAGYFLAGKTLRPIKEMLDEQNRFISDSSHELRTPLTTLRSEIEIALRDKNLNLKDAKKIIQSNLEEVITLQILSDRLLELSQNGKLVRKNLVEELSLGSVLTASIKKVNPMAKSKKINIKIKTGEYKIPGIFDRLVELFTILLDNSIKYSKSGGSIFISSEKKDGYINIFVKDYGLGIEKEDLPHIFDRFYRSDKSRKESGYGLGLSIAKKIVEAHRGSILVKSHPKKETVFTVTLPKI